MTASAPRTSRANASEGAPDPAPPEPLLQAVLSLARELPGLLSDRVELLSLELQRAGVALMQIVAMLVAAAVLGVTAWLVLWGGVIAALLAVGVHVAWALLLVLAVNVLAVAILLARMRALLPRLSLPATQRHLMPERTPERQSTEPSQHHDRPDLAHAGQPAPR